MDDEIPEQRRVGSGPQDKILTLLHAQSALLRSINDRLASLMEMLAPSEQEGPTLDELIARLIHLAQTQGVILDRLDAKVTALGTDLPPAVARALRRPGGAAP